VPINFLRGRQHEHLTAPASRTNLYGVAPIPRAIRYINDIITDDPDFDVFRMKEGKLHAIASSYLSKPFSYNEVESDWIARKEHSSVVSENTPSTSHYTSSFGIYVHTYNVVKLPRITFWRIFSKRGIFENFLF
jgi:hypothetical protein